MREMTESDTPPLFIMGVITFRFISFVLISIGKAISGDISDKSIAWEKKYFPLFCLNKFGTNNIASWLEEDDDEHEDEDGIMEKRRLKFSLCGAPSRALHKRNSFLAICFSLALNENCHLS